MATTVLPRCGLRLEEVHQELLRRRVDAGHRLVEQEQVGLRRQRAGEEHAPPLAARQAPDLRPQVALHADLGERVVDGAAVVAARPPDRPEAREAAHHHDVLDGDRERPVDVLGLRDVGDAPRLAPGGRPEDLDPARPRGEQPGHQLEQRALAGAVGADDREQAAGLDGDRDVLERGPLAVARGHVAQPDVGVRVGVRRRRARRRGGGPSGVVIETQYQLAAFGDASTACDVLPRAQWGRLARRPVRATPTYEWRRVPSVTIARPPLSGKQQDSPMSRRDRRARGPP